MTTLGTEAPFYQRDHVYFVPMLPRIAIEFKLHYRLQSPIGARMRVILCQFKDRTNTY